MRLFTLLLCLLASAFSYANMASPYEDGSTTGTPFTNQYVDILKEDLRITLDEKFEEAKYDISYFIDVKKEGISIPLLFLAEDFKRDFKVSIDSQVLELKQFEGDSALADFDYFLDEDQRVNVWWNRNEGRSVELRFLKYFEVDLPIGQHEIKVEYIGSSWMDKSNWVKEYSFRYILSPAKYWKSFGELNLHIDATKFKGEISTNFRGPDEGSLGAVASWHFDSLPDEVVKIDYNPDISGFAKFLIWLGPLGISLILGLCLMFLHIVGMWWHRKKSTARFSWVAILGGLAVVFSFVFCWIFSYEFIDGVIGAEASHYHGYVGVGIVFLAPFILIGYLLFAHGVDFGFARRG